ncbi:hypothetical protein KFU94_15970 [Chloroflexi bacterium TSY]|nr:hypothetical protein [Chloroflexi bacterium TSY]
MNVLKKPSFSDHIVLFCAVLLGLVLRTFLLGSTPFQHADDISTAWLTTYYFPRQFPFLQLDLDVHAPSSISGLLGAAHGPLQVLIAYTWGILMMLFNVPMVELSWHLPFALLGASVTLICYLLGSTLQSRRAGILAALFVSVLPLHVAFSRTSGESHFILASVIQPLALYFWWQYLQRGTLLWSFVVGLCVAADSLTDFFFPGLYLTMFLGGIVYFVAQQTTWRNAAWQSMRHMFSWPIVLPSLLAVQIHLFSFYKFFRLGEISGMFGRFQQEIGAPHTEFGGLFLDTIISNLIRSTNVVVFALAVVTLLLYIVIHQRLLHIKIFGVIQK